MNTNEESVIAHRALWGFKIALLVSAGDLILLLLIRLFYLQGHYSGLLSVGSIVFGKLLYVFPIIALICLIVWAVQGKSTNSTITSNTAVTTPILSRFGMVLKILLTMIVTIGIAFGGIQALYYILSSGSEYRYAGMDGIIFVIPLSLFFWFEVILALVALFVNLSPQKVKIIQKIVIGLLILPIIGFIVMAFLLG